MKETEKDIVDTPHIRILLIEDDEGHSELICSFLSKAGNIRFDTERTGLMSSAIDLLDKKKFDVVLSDLGLPDSRGMGTFERLHSRFPDIPLIVLTALDDENTALRALHEGAQDYLFKGRIDTSQLVRSIRYAIERQKLITELEQRLKEIRTLQGLLPMCAWCRSIRNDKGYWQSLEAYIQEHTDAAFTHGICPACMKKINPELYEKMEQEDQSEGRRREIRINDDE